VLTVAVAGANDCSTVDGLGGRMPGSGRQHHSAEWPSRRSTSFASDQYCLQRAAIRGEGEGSLRQELEGWPSSKHQSAVANRKVGPPDQCEIGPGEACLGNAAHGQSCADFIGKSECFRPHEALNDYARLTHSGVRFRTRAGL
jgi:hypothetical protein